MVDNPFASSTETSVYAQRTPLIDGKVLNTIQITYSAEVAISGADDIEMLTNEAIPKSFIGKLPRLKRAIENNPAKYPNFKLPTFRITRVSGNRTEKSFPLFWIRKDNIDIDSCWWNIYKELNEGNNNNETAFNDDYWIRDEDDPDINRVPGENFTKLSERPEIEASLQPFFTPQGAVPYELVYPEWFKLHPDYFVIKEQLSDFGINASRDLLTPLRESPSSKDIDHMLVGFFTGMLPSTESDIKYIFKFFRHIFRDNAFASPLAKKTSAPVIAAINTAGFYKQDGTNVGWINEEGSSLSQLKANNFYYEYSARDDADIDLTKIFEFETEEEDFSTELQVKDLFIRKVKGRLKSGKVWEMTLGKGLPYPEFTNNSDIVYPVDPTVTPNPADAPALNNYDNTVVIPHAKKVSNWKDLNPLNGERTSDCYISIKLQKGSSSGTHEWDTETVTGLTGKSVDYYEEIIIVNPRIEYRGIYSTAFKSPKAEECFQAGDLWESADRIDILDFNGTSYVVSTIPGAVRFLGIDGEADSLAIPVIDSVLRQLVLKEREYVLAKSLSTNALAIVRVNISFLKENFGLIIQIAFIVVGIITQNPELIQQGITLEALAAAVASAFIEAIIFGAIADVIVAFLVDVVGLEAAGQLVTLILAVATIYGVRTNGEFYNDDIFKLVSNFDDSWAELSQEDLLADVEQIEARRRENLRKLEDLRDSTEYLLADKDPNLALQTRVFQIDNETPEQFFARTLDNKNPGVGVYRALEAQIDRFKWISHKELPKIATDEKTDDEFIRNLL